MDDLVWGYSNKMFGVGVVVGVGIGMSNSLIGSGIEVDTDKV